MESTETMLTELATARLRSYERVSAAASPLSAPVSWLGRGQLEALFAPRLRVLFMRAPAEAPCRDAEPARKEEPARK